MVNCSNYRIGACLLGTCPNDRPECCQECSLDDCCPDRDCHGPDGKTQYAAGYINAADYDWLKLPIDDAIKKIDAYKLWALKKGSLYFAGVAQGAWDQLMGRELTA